MRYWIRAAVIGAIATVGSGTHAVALTAADDTTASSWNNVFGICTSTLNVSAGTGSGFASIYVIVPRGVYNAGRTFWYPGGTFWSGAGKATASAPNGALTETVLAACLSTPVSNITMNYAKGADAATYAAQEYMGFSFTLTTAAGGLNAGYHAYFVGSPPPAPVGGADPTLTDDALRSLNSTLASNIRLTRGARGRYLESRRAPGGDDGSIVSSKNVSFDVDGTFTASNGNLATKGNFFAQTGNFEDTQRRLVFGDFNLQRDDDTGSTTATISGKMAWEQLLSEKTMLGYFLGADLGRSNIKGSFTGTQNTYGISIGGYFVHALQQNMFIDGFASLGAGRNDLKMADDTLDLESNYKTRTVAVGAAISGSIEQSGYDILPELRVTYGKTSIGTVEFTDVATGLVNSGQKRDAGSVSKAAILFRPEFRVPMNEVSGFVSTAVFSFAPRLMCERIKVTTTTNDCGRGAEIGINSTSEDSLSFTNLKVIVDRVGSSTRQSLQYNLEYKF